MTEDRARLTQCCGGEGCGYVNPADSVRYCVASSCMAWRRHGNEVVHLTLDATPEGEGWTPLKDWSDGRYRTWERPSPHGWCGLAGKP